MSVVNETIDVMDETMKILDELNNIIKKELLEEPISNCPNLPPVSLQEKLSIIRRLAY